MCITVYVYTCITHDETPFIRTEAVQALTLHVHDDASSMLCTCIMMRVACSARASCKQHACIIRESHVYHRYAHELIHSPCWMHVI